MSSLMYKFYLMAAETFACITIIFLIFGIADKNEEIEQEVNASVNRKIDIAATYEDYESPEAYETGIGSNNLYLTGGALLSELITYDGSVTVQVNDMVINGYRTPTGEDVFEYMAKYGVPDDLADTVSVTRQYEKTYTADRNGKLVKVMYRLR